MLTNFRLAVVSALLASTGSYTATPLVASDPLKGIVLGGDVVDCVLERGAVYTYVHSLGKDHTTRGQWCAVCDGSPLRWHIGQGAFWVSQDLNWGVPPRPREINGGYLLRIELAVFSKTGEDTLHPFKRTDSPFHCDTPWLSFHAFDRRYFLYLDHLPTGKAQVRQFVVTNLTSKFGHREKDFEGGKSPACVFSCYLGESRWDTKAGVWKSLPGKHDWTTPAAFKEPFQALSLGDDYYFVTRSGSLYRAAKPAKGTDRTLARVWDGKARQIRSFVTDAKTGKTFLFVPPAKARGKPAFFELSDKPKLEEYDPKLVPPPKLEEPHRTIVHAARFLVALKKIDDKK